MPFCLRLVVLVSELPGSLIYHLVLCNTLGVAAAIAASRRQQSRDRSSARLSIATGGVFVLAVASFALTILAPMRGLDALTIVPPFERAVSTLAITLFGWSLAFPLHARRADAATASVAIMSLLALGISWVLWAPEVARAQFYNGSPQETTWEVAQIVLLLLGLSLLAVRRTLDWHLGIALFALLLLGHVVHYLLPLAGQNTPGSARLAEILAAAVWVVVVDRRAHRMASLALKVQAARSTPRALWPYVRPYWRGFLVPVLAVAASSVVSLLKPWPFKFLIDNVLQVGQPFGSAQGRPVGQPLAAAPIIVAIAGSIVAIAALQGLLSYSKEVFLSAMAQRVAFALRSALFAHIQRLPLAFHDRQRTGDLITRVTSDVTKVQELVTDDLLVGGATNVLQLAGMLVVMLVVDWKLGLIATLSAPMLFLTTGYYRKRIRAQEQQVRQKEGDITSLAQETISSIRVVKAFGRESFEAGRFEEQTGVMLEAGLKVARLEARFAWVLNVVTAVSLTALVSFGAYEVLVGALSTGTLVVFIQYMRDLQSPLTSLSRLSTKMAKATVRAERLVEVLNERPAVEERAGARIAPRFRGQVQFDYVSFGYGPAELVLRDINLTIEPGEAVAIVGATGAGKSTLASLILRLYDPSTGVVRIDGHDIREYKLDSLVNQISVVLQESLLFQTTIRENIAYGRPSATFKEIQEAARIAYCEEFVQRFPKGFDTVIGERGTTLSGGQRQRIAIARAVIRDAPILILDEPTTGLDAESEEIVLRTLEQLMRGRTTVMIAHKLSTVRRAKRIYVLDQGKMVEAGTHEELMAQIGPYARAFQLVPSG